MARQSLGKLVRIRRTFEVDEGDIGDDLLEFFTLGLAESPKAYFADVVGVADSAGFRVQIGPKTYQRARPGDEYYMDRDGRLTKA